MGTENVLGGDANQGKGMGAEGKGAGAGDGAGDAGDNSGGDAGAAGGAGDSGGSAGDSGAGGEGAAAWLKDYPKEYHDDRALNPIESVEGLLKSYVNAQRLIGADKIVLPGKHGTESEWRGVKHKLGLPQEIKDYDLALPEGHKLDEKTITSVKEEAFKLGILPKDLSGLVSWFDKNSQADMKGLNERADEEVTKELKAYKTEVGDLYEKNVLRANAAIREFAPEGFGEFLSANGLGASVPLIKFMAKIGESLDEDKIVGEAGVKFGLTTDEVKGKVSSILGDKNHAYHDKKHPDHDRAVLEMQKYFKMQYGNEPAVNA